MAGAGRNESWAARHAVADLGKGGVKADGSPYVFDGDMEAMPGVRYRY